MSLLAGVRWPRMTRGGSPPRQRLVLKRAKVTYAELARRLETHALPGETEASVSSKLGRGTFAATFWLASLAALGMEAMRLEDL
jgi:hypothetical protein